MQKSPPSKIIPLLNLTRVEPGTEKEGCLVVEYGHLRHPQRSTAGTTARKLGSLFILFKSYDELYTWRDALYDRCQLSAPIGNPTGFKHNAHVGYDPLSGTYVVGLINCARWIPCSIFCLLRGYQRNGNPTTPQRHRHRRLWRLLQ